MAMLKCAKCGRSESIAGSCRFCNEVEDSPQKPEKPVVGVSAPKVGGESPKKSKPARKRSTAKSEGGVSSGHGGKREGAGRPRIHESDAVRQAEYRKRKRKGGGDDGRT